MIWSRNIMDLLSIIKAVYVSVFLFDTFALLAQPSHRERKREREREKRVMCLSMLKSYNIHHKLEIF